MKSKLKKVFITFVTFLILTSICSINTNPEQIRKEIDDINNKIEKLENEKGGINILKNYRIPLKDAQIAKLQYEEFMIEQKFWMGGFFQFWSNLINSKYIGRAIVLTVILFLVPVAIKILLFFICSPRLSKVNTQIFKPSNSSGEANIVQSGRSISVNIPDDGIFVKDETYVNGTEGAVQLNRTIFKKSQTKMSFMLNSGKRLSFPSCIFRKLAQRFLPTKPLAPVTRIFIRTSSKPFC